MAEPRQSPSSCRRAEPTTASATLHTLQRHALSHLFGRREFTPEEVAALDYAQVEQLPKIGAKGIDAIRSWLHRYGYDLNNLPLSQVNDARKQQRLQQRLDHAKRLLQRHGYRVQPPE